MLIYNYLYYNYTISSISFMSAAKKTKPISNNPIWRGDT